MRYLVFLFLLTFGMNISVYAQDDYYGEKGKKKTKDIKDVAPMPSAFIGVNNGINNMAGLIGVNLAAPILNPVVVEVSGGIGLWGFKTAVDVQVYLPKKYPFGGYFKAGYSRSSGYKDYFIEDSIPSGGTQTVHLELKRVDNLFFTVGWALRVPRKHKIYLEMGYALNLTPNYYRVVTPNVVLSDDTEFLIGVMKPSGIIIGLGFSFGF